MSPSLSKGVPGEEVAISSLKLVNQGRYPSVGVGEGLAKEAVRYHTGKSLSRRPCYHCAVVGTAKVADRGAKITARRALDPDGGSCYLASDNDSLVLCPGSSLWVDVEAFKEAAAL